MKSSVFKKMDSLVEVIVEEEGGPVPAPGAVGGGSVPEPDVVVGGLPPASGVVSGGTVPEPGVVGGGPPPETEVVATLIANANKKIIDTPPPTRIHVFGISVMQ